MRRFEFTQKGNPFLILSMGHLIIARDDVLSDATGQLDQWVCEFGVRIDKAIGLTTSSSG